MHGQLPCKVDKNLVTNSHISG